MHKKTKGKENEKENDDTLSVVIVTKMQKHNEKSLLYWLQLIALAAQFSETKIKT